MFDRLEKLIEFVERDNSNQLYSLLIEELLLPKQIPLKYIAGALVIAAEKNSIACFDIILDYNSRLAKQIPKAFIRAACSMFPVEAAEMSGCNYLKSYESTVH